MSDIQYKSIEGYFNGVYIPVCTAPVWGYIYYSGDSCQASVIDGDMDYSAQFQMFSGIIGISSIWIDTNAGSGHFEYSDLAVFPMGDGVHAPDKKLCIQMGINKTGGNIFNLVVRFARKNALTGVIEHYTNDSVIMQCDLTQLETVHFAFQPGRHDGKDYYIAALIAKIGLGHQGDYSNRGAKALDLTDKGPDKIIPSGYEPKPETDDDPNKKDPDGPSGPGGGGGDHDPNPDPVPLPDQTGLDNLGCGFVNYFRVTMAEVINLANDVYSDNIWQQIRNYFTHPADMIAGLFMLPVTPPVGASFKPQVGPVVFNHWFPLITQQYVEAHCGTLYIAEYFGSCFDYSPYSSIDIYLPFIGMRSLDVDEVMGKFVQVEYKVDVTNGDCIAFILVGADALSMGVRYQFSGNCAMQIPVSTANMDSVIQNAVSFATTAVATVATAGAAGGAAGTAALAAGASEADAALISASAQSAANWEAAGDIGASAISAVMGSKPSVERSGCNGSALGFMGVLYPFIIRKVPRQSLPDNYRALSGYPSNISGTLGSFSGLTIVETVRLQGIQATDNEIAEIEKLLRGGVII